MVNFLELVAASKSNDESILDAYNDELSAAHEDNATKIIGKQAKSLNVIGVKADWGKYALITKTDVSDGSVHTVETYEYRELGVRSKVKIVLYINAAGEVFTCNFDAKTSELSSVLPFDGTETRVEFSALKILAVVQRNLIPASERHTNPRKFWYGVNEISGMVKARNDLNAQRTMARKMIKGDLSLDEQKFLDQRVLSYEAWIAGTRENAKLDSTLYVNGTAIPVE